MIGVGVLLTSTFKCTNALAEETDETRKAELIEAIRNGSEVSWQHFNLHGEFDFSDDRMLDSFGLIDPKEQPPRKF